MSVKRNKSKKSDIEIILPIMCIIVQIARIVIILAPFILLISVIMSYFNISIRLK